MLTPLPGSVVPQHNVRNIKHRTSPGHVQIRTKVLHWLFFTWAEIFRWNREVYVKSLCIRRKLALPICSSSRLSSISLKYVARDFDRHEWHSHNLMNTGLQGLQLPSSVLFNLEPVSCFFDNLSLQILWGVWIGLFWWLRNQHSGLAVQLWIYLVEH